MASELEPEEKLIFQKFFSLPVVTKSTIGLSKINFIIYTTYSKYNSLLLDIINKQVYTMKFGSKVIISTL